jgi:hypothetical protein
VAYKSSASDQSSKQFGGSTNSEALWKLMGIEQVEILIFLEDSGLGSEVGAIGERGDWDEGLVSKFMAVARSGKGRERMRLAFNSRKGKMRMDRWDSRSKAWGHSRAMLFTEIHGRKGIG